MMKPLKIDCAEANWKTLLKQSMTLRYNARTKAWLFKKPSAPIRVL